MELLLVHVYGYLLFDVALVHTHVRVNTSKEEEQETRTVVECPPVVENLANTGRLGPGLSDIGMVTETIVESPLSQSRAFSLERGVRKGRVSSVGTMHGTHEASRAFT